VSSGNTAYSSVDGVLFNEDQTTLIQYPEGKQGAYTIPNSVISIGDEAFAGCTGLTSITIPNSVTTIGGSAFAYCTGLTSVTIPNSVTSIGGIAFGGCTGLTSVTIPNSVISIGEMAFGGCSRLMSVTIPNSVISIGEMAFGGCSRLMSVISLGSTPPTLGGGVFGSIPANACLHVPGNAKDAYRTADGWKDFNCIQGVESVYTVKFDLQGGSGVGPQIIDTDAAPITVARPPNPTYTDYVFGGWYKEPECVNSWYFNTDVVISDTTLYAKWTQLTRTYIVRWVLYSNLVTAIVETVAEGYNLEPPTWGGLYSISSWYREAECINPWNFDTDVVTSDIRLYPKYTAIDGNGVYTITFNANGGSVTPASTTTGRDGRLFGIPNPTRSGYTFNGWYTQASDGTQVTAGSGGTVFTSDLTVYARWTPNSSGGGDDDEPETYTIKFDANGGAVSPASRKTNTSGKVSLPTPEREGYTFEGWYTKSTGGNEVTKNTEFEDDATIYAHWTVNTYKVTFSAGSNGVITAEVGGKDIKTGADVEYGKSVTFTAEPADGYKVSGWKLGSRTVSGNKTEIYTVGEVKEAVTVTVSFAKTDAILTPDRVIPNVKPDEEATVVAPVSQLSGEFTAGPNPVGRELGAVGFFRQGKRIASGELRIYDAVGNVVSKVKIVDKALGSQARRQVGSWDLTDVKGRPVSEGTYLVRGVLKTSDGKKEKVSVIVGVR